MSVSITEAAAKELKRFQEEEKLGDDALLRIGVVGGGCAGFQYELDYVPANAYQQEKDKLLSCSGVNVVIDKKSLLYLDGITLDFYSDLTQRGFVFNNPNAQGGCGCGKSFST